MMGIHARQNYAMQLMHALIQQGMQEQYAGHQAVHAIHWRHAQAHQHHAQQI
jgi:hypothetical protein